MPGDTWLGRPILARIAPGLAAPKTWAHITIRPPAQIITYSSEQVRKEVH